MNNIEITYNEFTNNYGIAILREGHIIEITMCQTAHSALCELLAAIAIHHQFDLSFRGFDHPALESLAK